MKIAEQFIEDGGQWIVKSTFDFNPALKYARQARDAHEAGHGLGPDYVPIATVPLEIVHLWLQEAGVAWDDPAADDVLRRKLIDGDWSKFRIDDRAL